MNGSYIEPMSTSEIHEVSGGTLDQCITGASLAGGLLGAGLGAFSSFGFGVEPGFMGGAAIGGAIGYLACPLFYS